MWYFSCSIEEDIEAVVRHRVAAEFPVDPDEIIFAIDRIYKDKENGIKAGVWLTGLSHALKFFPPATSVRHSDIKLFPLSAFIGGRLHDAVKRCGYQTGCYITVFIEKDKIVFYGIFSGSVFWYRYVHYGWEGMNETGQKHFHKTLMEGIAVTAESNDGKSPDQVFIVSPFPCVFLLREAIGLDTGLAVNYLDLGAPGVNKGPEGIIHDRLCSLVKRGTEFHDGMEITPPEIKAKRRRKAALIRTFVFFCTFFLLASGTITFFSLGIFKAEREARSLRKEISRLKEVALEAENIGAMIEKWRQHIKSRRVFRDNLQALIDRIDIEAGLNELSCDGNGCSVRGAADKSVAINDLVRELDEAGNFRSVDLRSAVARRVSGSEKIDFEIYLSEK
jgi:hypothetical protein